MRNAPRAASVAKPLPQCFAANRQPTSTQGENGSSGAGVCGPTKPINSCVSFVANSLLKNRCGGPPAALRGARSPVYWSGARSLAYWICLGRCAPWASHPAILAAFSNEPSGSLDAGLTSQPPQQGFQLGAHRRTGAAGRLRPAQTRGRCARTPRRGLRQPPERCLPSGALCWPCRAGKYRPWSLPRAPRVLRQPGRRVAECGSPT